MQATYLYFVIVEAMHLSFDLNVPQHMKSNDVGTHFRHKIGVYFTIDYRKVSRDLMNSIINLASKQEPLTLKESTRLL